jgi:hypothetical protein
MDKVLSVTLSIDSNEFDATEHRDPSKVDPARRALSPTFV